VLCGIKSSTRESARLLEDDGGGAGNGWKGNAAFANSLVG
jgi:hypothetical protein